MVKHVFVYGTLRVGQHAYRSFNLEERTTHVGTFTLPNASMVNLGGFPGIYLDGGPGVVGDLLSFSDDSLLRGLDHYEGEGSLYHRRVVEVNGEQAYVYEYAHPQQSNPTISPGDWLNRNIAS